MVNEENFNENEEQLFFPEQPKRSRSRILLAIVIPVLLLLAGGAGYFLFLGDGENALSSFNPFVALRTNNEEKAPAATEEVVDDSFLYSDTTYIKNEETASTDLALEGWSTAEGGKNGNTTPEMAAPETKENTIASVTPKIEESPKPSKEPVAEKRAITPAVEKAPEAANGIASPSVPARYYVIIGGFSIEENAYKLRDQLVNKGNAGARVIVPKSGGNLLKVSYADFDTFNTAAEKAQELKAEYGSSVWVFKY